MIDICEPLTELCPHCGEDHTYYCGRLLLLRDPTNPDEACLDGTRICGDCADGFKEFLDKAYNAKAVREEWDGS